MTTRTIIKWERREERLALIRQFYQKQNAEHVIDEQLKNDSEWDIRGTIQCASGEHFIDFCFREYVKQCPCEGETK